MGGDAEGQKTREREKRRKKEEKKKKKRRKKEEKKKKKRRKKEETRSNKKKQQNNKSTKLKIYLRTHIMLDIRVVLIPSKCNSQLLRVYCCG